MVHSWILCPIWNWKSCIIKKVDWYRNFSYSIRSTKNEFWFVKHTKQLISIGRFWDLSLWFIMEFLFWKLWLLIPCLILKYLPSTCLARNSRVTIDAQKNKLRIKVSLHIQSECRKIRTRKYSVFGHFSSCDIQASGRKRWWFQYSHWATSTRCRK